MAIGALPESYGQVNDHALGPIRRRLCAAPAYLASHVAGAKDDPQLSDEEAVLARALGRRIAELARRLA